MEPKKQRKFSEESRLPILGAAFLLGAVAGSLCCARIDPLRLWLEEQGQADLTFLRVFLPEGALLCGMALCGLLRPGCLLSPVLLAGKGFALSARAVVAVAAGGGTGYAQMLVLELLPGFLSVAALMLLGRQAMGWSALRLHRPKGKGRALLPDGTFALTFALCMGLDVLSAALRLWLTPKLWSAALLLLPKL